MQGCVKADDGTPCDTPASQASRAANKKKKKKKPITIGSTTIIPIKVKKFCLEFYLPGQGKWLKNLKNNREKFQN